MMPTMMEFMTTYNPWWHIFLMNVRVSKQVVKLTYDKIHSVFPQLPDGEVLKHIGETTFGHLLYFVAPMFGVQTEKVTPTDCACDEPKIIQEQAKFSCEFHITQDDASEAFESPDDLAEYDTETLMSIHLDTFLDQRYEWYSKRMEQLPGCIRKLVYHLMSLLSVPFNTLMFLAKNSDMWLQDMIKHAAKNQVIA